MDVAENTCLVCHEAVEIFALGQCDHPICFKCSTRMRALCEHYYCPICRTDLPEVYFLQKVEKFGEMPIKNFIANKRYKIQFENEDIKHHVEQLLAHKCDVCKDRQPEKSFKALKDHMRKMHSLFYCDLCLGLKIFTSERKLYDRQTLATHRRMGDKDDSSYKGHPLCRFCDERYLDRDELYKHLRKDHYYCHFCESSGSQEYYADYEVLRDHFRKDHFLCEEGECATVQFENAFKSDIDLKGHRASHHSKGQSKQQARQERTLNIDINLVPRPTTRPQRGGGDRGDTAERGQHSSARGRGGRGGGRHSERGMNRDEDLQRAIQASLSTMKEEEVKKKPTASEDRPVKMQYMASDDQFPTLGAQGGASVVPAPNTTIAATSSTSDTINTTLADRFAIANNMSVQHGMLGQQDFPSLSAQSAVRQHVEDFPSLSGKSAPRQHVEDFPSLSGKSAPRQHVEDFSSLSGKSAPRQHVEDFPSLSTQSAPRQRVEDFPVLGSSAKPTIPVTTRPNAKPASITQSRTANQQSRPTSAYKPKIAQEDFPELPLKKPPQPSLASWVSSAPANVQATDNINHKATQKKPKPDTAKVSKPPIVTNIGDEDFPSLGPSNNSSYNDKWFKSSSKTRKETCMNDEDVPDHWDEENVSINITDRYSPVNIPKSPETNKKTKNKKKKKKEKSAVSEVREESVHLKNNASLDDIASFFMAPAKLTASNAEEVKAANTSAQQEIKAEPAKQPTKQKVDHIDKKDVAENLQAGSKIVPEVIKSDLNSLKNFATPSKFSEENFQVAERKPVVPKPRFSIAEEDFPSLDVQVSKKSPPPGFNKNKPNASYTSPPGLGKAAPSKPPPGFSASKLADLSKEMFPTFPAPKDVVPMSTNLSNFEYLQPEGFSDRNKQLINMVQSACETPIQFTEFKTISGEFRRSEINAEDYYVRCESILGKSQFAQIYPELLALLPDIRKQQDLMSVFMMKEGIKKDDGVLKISGKSQNAKGAWTMTASGFLSCQTCKQVLLRKDYNKHMASHALDSQEFPTLGDVPSKKSGWQAIY